MADVTELLEKWRNGDQLARDELMARVNSELRRLAKRYLRHERPDHTLQPTALVNEAYLRLVAQGEIKSRNRNEFFGVAANLMRHILVEHARARQAAKRGGAQYTISLSQADRPGPAPQTDLLALHDALNRLADLDPRQSRLVELRFFGGLTIDETAEVLSISHATVERDWKVVRAWLRRELS
jgi:RNA polymerase sigma-70 factor (ECF subfamily)